MRNRDKNASRPRAGSEAAALAALEQAREGWPDPPAAAALRKCELPFWRAVMICRLPQSWAEADLVHAANLARCWSDIETQRRRLYREGDVIEARLNPRHRLLETLNRRALAITRILQLHAVVQPSGEIDKNKGQKGEAGRAAALIGGGVGNANTRQKDGWDPDSLLAGAPRLQ